MDEESLTRTIARSLAQLMVEEEQPAPLNLPRDTRELFAEAAQAPMMFSERTLDPWSRHAHSRNDSDVSGAHEAALAMERSYQSLGPSAFAGIGGGVNSLRTGSFDFGGLGENPGLSRSLNSSLKPGYAASVLTAHQDDNGFGTRSLNSSLKGGFASSVLAGHQDDNASAVDGWNSPQHSAQGSVSQQLAKLFEGPHDSPRSSTSSIWADPPASHNSSLPPPAPSTSHSQIRMGGTSVKQRHITEPSKLRNSSTLNQTKYYSHGGQESGADFLSDERHTSESSLGHHSNSHHRMRPDVHDLPPPPPNDFSLSHQLKSNHKPYMDLPPPPHESSYPQHDPLNLSALQQAYLGHPMYYPSYNPYTMQLFPMIPPLGPMSYDPYGQVYPPASPPPKMYNGSQGGMMYPPSPPPPPPPGMSPGYAGNRQQHQHGYNDDSTRGGARSNGCHSDSLLELFKHQGCPASLSLREISGHIYEFAKDQYGSRHLQLKLDACSTDEVCAVINELLPHPSDEETANGSKILQLVTDVFGNYVIQKLLERGPPDHKARIAGTLKGHILTMSLQMYGCRVVQRCFEVLPLASRLDLLSELDPQVMRCVQDSNGNHVIQKIIECLPSDKIAHILDKFITCVLALCLHPYGCRVIQRVLENCRDEERRAQFMDVILKSSCKLAEDQYGNYVGQHIVEKGLPSERLHIITTLLPKILQMSQHKFASNVVEKCLIYGSVEERDLLVQGMLGKGGASESAHPEGQDPFQKMMIDQYGNYVVQKVLEVCDDVQRGLVMAHVRTQTEALKKQAYGKHIVARVEKLLATGMKISAGALPIPSDNEVSKLQQRSRAQQ